MARYLTRSTGRTAPEPRFRSLEQPDERTENGEREGKHGKTAIAVQNASTDEAGIDIDPKQGQDDDPDAVLHDSQRNHRQREDRPCPRRPEVQVTRHQAHNEQRQGGPDAAAFLGIPKAIADWVSSLGLSPFMLIVALIVFYLIVQQKFGIVPY